METAIGVFSSRERAAEAVRQLQGQNVPREALVFLSRSESETRTIARAIGAAVGGFVGSAASMSAGVVAAASLLLPEIGAVFALGFGAASLLGLSRPGAAENQPSSEDVAFFREVLKQGRSLIVVRTESPELAARACAILDRLGIGMQPRPLARMTTSTRQLGEVVVLDIGGRITLGEGNVMLREVIRKLAENGITRIVMNLREVVYVDSSGLGELVRTHLTIHGKGGRLKLTNLHPAVHELLHTTKLASVFDIHPDEAAAIQSFNGPASVEGVA